MHAIGFWDFSSLALWSDVAWVAFGFEQKFAIAVDGGLKE